MNQKTILVVEDDQDGRDVVGHVLEHLNVTVRYTKDGEEASRVLFTENARFDAAVIDLALPGVDGWELLRRIKDDVHTKSMPCIAVTAFTNSDVRVEAKKAGFDAFMPKPLDVVAFADVIKTVFEK